MVRDAIEQALKNALAHMGAGEVSFSIEYPPAEVGAQYASNAALAAAKMLGKPPREVAKKLCEALQGCSIACVERIEIAGPGFLNFFLTRDFFADLVGAARSAGETWGHSAALQGDAVLIEYTSPNLFKPLHIGNLVGNILGESIARLFEAHHAKVWRINYPSDIGLTVAKGVWGIKAKNLNPADISQLGEAYVAGNAAYESDEESKKEIEAINRALYEGSDAGLQALRQEGIETSRRHLDELCAKLGTVFNGEFFESESGQLGRELVRAHLADGMFEQSDGATIYRGEQDGLHTRVFLNSQGLPTYEAKELGLFELKSRRYPDFSLSITVTGSEQKDFFKVVFSVIGKVFAERVAGRKLLHISNGFLTLTTGKMSSRKGNVISGESLIADMVAASEKKMGEREVGDRKRVAQQVGVAAIKYAILKQASGKNIIFDPEKSLSFEGDSGPYLQYAHARACSILRKAKEESVTPATSAPGAEVAEPERLLSRFPEIVAHAAREYEPHHVAQYLTELAGAFNSWYAREHVLDGTSAAAYKLAIVDAVAVTLKNGLWLLGIEAPQEM